MKTKATSFYTETDYRNALKSRQKQLKNTLGSAYSVGQMADTIRVQRTYLSKVFAGGADLSDDQLYLALQYLKFIGDEAEYLRLLHAYQRSGLTERRRELETRLNELRQSHRQAEINLTTQTIRESEKAADYQKYFLDPLVQLVHMFLTVDRFRKNSRAILETLHIPETRWQNILSTLIELDFITVNSDEIQVTRDHVMLPKNSPIMNAYHLLAKVNSTARLHEIPPEQKNSMTMIVTCTKDSAEQIRQQLVQFLKAIEKIGMQDEKPTDVYQLSLDLFGWT
jgi:uncharacterized protein (TIGR02147 family)